MGLPEMLRENVATVNSLQAMTDEDRSRMERILDEFAVVGERFCTGCGYCMDCPNGVNIPRNFRIHNMGRVYGLMDWAKLEYAGLDADKRADACAECGECEPKCPNKIPIVEQLEQVGGALGQA
jgi:predicted aldo/keto reductase-like oxidoreductase